MFLFSSLQVNPELTADYWDIHKLIKYLKVSSNLSIFELFFFLRQLWSEEMAKVPYVPMKKSIFYNFFLFLLELNTTARHTQNPTIPDKTCWGKLNIPHFFEIHEVIVPLLNENAIPLPPPPPPLANQCWCFCEGEACLSKKL